MWTQLQSTYSRLKKEVLDELAEKWKLEEAMEQLEVAMDQMDDGSEDAD